MQSGQRPADERRRAAMQPTPTPEEAKEQYRERLETMDNPPTPAPTQAEADLLLTGAAAPSEPAAAAKTERAEPTRERGGR